jgi:S-adenosylmethionine decarboxylase
MTPVGTLYLFRAEGISFELLDSLEQLKTILRNCLTAANTTIVAELFHVFEPQGITGVFVLQESHCAVHTWPELGILTADVFTCGERFQAESFAKLLSSNLGNEVILHSEIKR